MSRKQVVGKLGVSTHMKEREGDIEVSDSEQI